MSTILHADLDAFFASVEQRDHPVLRGRPVVVGGGVVMAASYEARARGVRSAMGGAQARRLCPGLVVVRTRLRAYVDASREVFAILEHFTPVVEPVSIDEAFLDVHGLERIAGTPTEIAHAIRKEVRERAGLPITIGVARTRFLAKVASGLAKPDGLLVVGDTPEEELAFLLPLDVGRLWGIGPRTVQRLHAHGIRTVAQAAALDETTLIRIAGRAGGRRLHALVSRREDRPRKRRTKGRRSIGSQCALGRRRPKSPEALDAVVLAIADRLAYRLRKADRRARTVVLRLRFDDFTRATRSRTLGLATAQTRAILAIARELMTQATPLLNERGVTLVGLTLTSLERSEHGQLVLPLTGHRAAVLDHTVDAIRRRYGSAAITRATLLAYDRRLVDE